MADRVLRAGVAGHEGRAQTEDQGQGPARGAHVFLHVVPGPAAGNVGHGAAQTHEYGVRHRCVFRLCRGEVQACVVGGLAVDRVAADAPLVRSELTGDDVPVLLVQDGSSTVVVRLQHGHAVADLAQHQGAVHRIGIRRRALEVDVGTGALLVAGVGVRDLVGEGPRGEAPVALAPRAVPVEGVVVDVDDQVALAQDLQGHRISGGLHPLAGDSDRAHLDHEADRPQDDDHDQCEEHHHGASRRRLSSSPPPQGHRTLLAGAVGTPSRWRGGWRRRCARSPR